MSGKPFSVESSNCDDAVGRPAGEEGQGCHVVSGQMNMLDMFNLVTSRRWNKGLGEDRELPSEDLRGYHMQDRTGLFLTAQMEGT